MAAGGGAAFAAVVAHVQKSDYGKHIIGYHRR